MIIAAGDFAHQVISDKKQFSAQDVPVLNKQRSVSTKEAMDVQIPIDIQIPVEAQSCVASNNNQSSVDKIDDLKAENEALSKSVLPQDESKKSLKNGTDSYSFGLQSAGSSKPETGFSGGSEQSPTIAPTGTGTGISNMPLDYPQDGTDNNQVQPVEQLAQMNQRIPQMGSDIESVRNKKYRDYDHFPSSLNSELANDDDANENQAQDVVGDLSKKDSGPSFADALKVAPIAASILGGLCKVATHLFPRGSKPADPKLADPKNNSASSDILTPSRLVGGGLAAGGLYCGYRQATAKGWSGGGGGGFHGSKPLLMRHESLPKFVETPKTAALEPVACGRILESPEIHQSNIADKALETTPGIKALNPIVAGHRLDVPLIADAKSSGEPHLLSDRSPKLSGRLLSISRVALGGMKNGINRTMKLLPKTSVASKPLLNDVALKKLSVTPQEPCLALTESSRVVKEIIEQPLAVTASLSDEVAKAGKIACADTAKSLISVNVLRVVCGITKALQWGLQYVMPVGLCVAQHRADIALGDSAAKLVQAKMPPLQIEQAHQDPAKLLGSAPAHESQPGMLVRAVAAAQQLLLQGAKGLRFLPV